VLVRIELGEHDALVGFAEPSLGGQLGGVGPRHHHEMDRLCAEVVTAAQPPEHSLKGAHFGRWAGHQGQHQYRSADQGSPEKNRWGDAETFQAQMHGYKTAVG
jgi:hypothetical protein